MEIESVLKNYTNQLRRFFISRVRDHFDADDLVQEVFRKTLVHFKDIKDQDKFRAWFFSVARNTLIDYYRKSARYSNEDLSLVATELEESKEIEKKLSKCIKPFIDQLPDKYRHVLEEVELNNKSQKEVAYELDMTYSTLKTRVQRGRDLLRKLFHECCQYELDIKGSIVDFRPKSKSCNLCI